MLFQAMWERQWKKSKVSRFRRFFGGTSVFSSKFFPLRLILTVIKDSHRIFFSFAEKFDCFQGKKHRLQGCDSLSRFSVILILRKKVVFFQFRRNFDLVANYELELFFSIFSRLCLFGPISVCMQKIEGGMFFFKSCNKNSLNKPDIDVCSKDQTNGYRKCTSILDQN